MGRRRKGWRRKAQKKQEAEARAAKLTRLGAADLAASPKLPKLDRLTGGKYAVSLHRELDGLVNSEFEYGHGSRKGTATINGWDIGRSRDEPINVIKLSCHSPARRRFVVEVKVENPLVFSMLDKPNLETQGVESQELYSIFKDIERKL